MPTANIVLTHLLTSQIDPQRGKHWEPSLEPYLNLIASLNYTQGNNSSLVILNDCFDEEDGPLERVYPTSENVYVQRHEHSLHWLMQHKEVEYVFLVDGSDVEMLQAPWEHLKPGTLYLGSEESVVGNRWMRQEHPSDQSQRFISEHYSQRLYNAGIIGGDRKTVMTFLADMLEFWHLGSCAGDKGDMCILNQAVFHCGFPIVTGHRVHTRFKAYEPDNGYSWWRHK